MKEKESMSWTSPNLQSSTLWKTLLKDWEVTAI
jgi:hypothetical protein